MAETHIQKKVFPFVILGEFTPQIAKAIFRLLDPDTLKKCRKVSKVWKNHVDFETNLWVNKPLAKAIRLRDVGRTTLHEAAKLGSLEICRLITANTEDSNPKTVLGVTPLHEAADGGHLEVCQLLLDIIETKTLRTKMVKPLCICAV